MSKLKIEMDHCFGIRHLSQEFNCNNNVHLIYAPNGSMKTSFAKTMRFVSKQSKIQPCDLLHPDDSSYKGSMVVKIDEQLVKNEQLFVADGDEDIDASKSFANFLASAELKSKYDNLYNSLTSQKNALMSRLGTESISSDCENELLASFRQDDGDTIYTVLERLANEITSSPVLPAYDFKYNDIFDTKNKVREFIDSTRTDLKTYFDQYSKLISESTIYRSKDGHTFGTYQASQLEKSVSDGDFFAVDHKIILNGQSNPINTIDDFKVILQKEQKRVLSDPELRKIFDKITSIIDKKTELRGLKKILKVHPDWVQEILDYDGFRKKVWKGHLAKTDLRVLLDSYNKEYVAIKDELDQVLADASQEQQKWKDIINLYKERFIVPFHVEMENQRDIILKQDAAKLKFFYDENGTNSIEEDKDSLVNNILSRGEKRAFHILQLLFELESRKGQDFQSIIVMDDIADSFDYQNKYAIIEYIKDLTDHFQGKFVLLILTHNFDFYRTVASRLLLKRDSLWMVHRDSQGNITFEIGQYVYNVFENLFLGHDDNSKIFVSMIPYVRNLIEYTKGKQDNDYLILTSCMHFKTDTNSITEQDIIKIMSNYTPGKGMQRKPTNIKVIDTIMQTAESIANEVNPNPVIIENKIVLSLAMRYMAEKYMHYKLINAGEKEEDLNYTSVKTGKLTGLYKQMLPKDTKKDIIERVNMMTPEMIHLNSFMYEPLIDLSLAQLLVLYNRCKNDLN